MPVVDVIRHVNGKPNPEKFGVILLAPHRVQTVVRLLSLIIQKRQVKGVRQSGRFGVIGGNGNIL